MCGRYTITSPPETIKSYFGYSEQPNFPPRYNIAPTQPIPIVRMNAEKVEFALVRWGLVPAWVKEISPSKPLINARAETLLEKPSFKKAAMRRRCLLPVNGYYEWYRAKDAPPLPYYIQQKEGDLFAIAGVWEHWQDANGNELESAALITTQANKTLSPIHHRMPVILDKAAQERWLNVAECSAKEVYEDLIPADDELLMAHRVSARVNKVANDDPELLTAIIDEPELTEQDSDTQMSLF